MEEPGDQLLFVLATTEIDKVPDTIVSRCQVFNFRSISTSDVAERLEYIAKQEWIEYEKEALEHIAALGWGAMRDAIKYLEQIHVLWAVNSEAVTKFLWVASRADIATFLDGVESNNYEQVQSRIDQFDQSWISFKAVGTDIIRGVDERFNSNPKLWSKVTLVLNELIRSSRYYPQPSLLWKSKFYVLMRWSDATDLSTMPTTVQSVPKQKSKQLADETASVETETPQKSEQGQSQNQNQLPKQNISLPDDLLIQVAEQVKWMIIKSTLKTQSHVEKYEEWVLHVTVINQQFHTAISKPEVVEEIETILKNLLSVDMRVVFSYMSKDEFMQKQLLG